MLERSNTLSVMVAELLGLLGQSNVRLQIIERVRQLLQNTDMGCFDGTLSLSILCRTHVEEVHDFFLSENACLGELRTWLT